MNHRVANLRTWAGRRAVRALRTVGDAITALGHKIYFWSLDGVTRCPRCNEVIHLENWGMHKQFGCDH
jgi:hypothetical protein